MVLNPKVEAFQGWKIIIQNVQGLEKSVRHPHRIFHYLEVKIPDIGNDGVTLTRKKR